MMLGTYKSESAMHHFAPANVPKPLAWGTCKRDPNEHFYICDFRDMTDDLPDIKKFPALVAKIHRDSMMGPPGRRFGFKVDTHLANIANDNTWSDTWEEWYTGAFEQMLVEEEKSHGPDDELTSLASSMCEKVVPRLLRPLETGGRYIRPCLIHSDLRPEHVKADALTGEPIIFDSCAFWGHNEGWSDHPRQRKTTLKVQQRTLDHGALLVISLGVNTWTNTISMYQSQLQRKMAMIGMPCMRCKSSMWLTSPPGAFAIFVLTKADCI